MTDLFWDSLCKEHGGLSHAVVHEASHAVVAIHLGVSFVDVSGNSDPWNHRFDETRVIGGGVRLTSIEDFERRVREDPLSSLQFCLAGALGERAAFAHSLDRSYELDVNLWRTLAGLREEQTMETIERALGVPIAELTASTNAILKARSSSLVALAQLLGESADLSLTFNEVAEIVTHHG